MVLIAGSWYVSESPGCFVPGRYEERQFLTIDEAKPTSEFRICCVRNTGASRVPERNSLGWSEWVGILHVTYSKRENGF